MELIGFVQNGIGQGQTFTQIEWVREQFRAKLGFDPFPGTLNVRVANPVALDVWKRRPGVVIEPKAEGYCPARCYHIQVSGSVQAAWIIPDVPGYPCDLVEIVAPVSLRETLKLKTGDIVRIKLVEEAK